MRYDIHLIFIMIAIGLFCPKLSWKGWFAVSLLIMCWMALNLWKGLHS